MDFVRSASEHEKSWPAATLCKDTEAGSQATGSTEPFFPYLKQNYLCQLSYPAPLRLQTSAKSFIRSVRQQGKNWLKEKPAERSQVKNKGRIIAAGKNGSDTGCGRNGDIRYILLTDTQLLSSRFWHGPCSPVALPVFCCRLLQWHWKHCSLLGGSPRKQHVHLRRRALLLTSSLSRTAASSIHHLAQKTPRRDWRQGNPTGWFTQLALCMCGAALGPWLLKRLKYQKLSLATNILKESYSSNL